MILANNNNTYSSLTVEQKKATGLLSIGTFLEFFDLMLYVHMAVLLNELFFPKTDPHTAALLYAFTFCTTFVFQPISALILGWVGDNIGRKATVILSTFIMAISCLVMANLPTYEQIGIAASWIMVICRICQGLSSMGEIVGSEVYLTEAIKPPVQYPIVTIIAVFSILGGTVALGVASVVISYGLNWRIAFWIGAAVALIGTSARTTLRETLDFADAKSKMEKTFECAEVSTELLKDNHVYNQRASNKTILALFFIQCGWPICFYFSYIHCGNMLKTIFDYNAEQIIHQNFISSLANLIGYMIITYLSYKIHPLKILKAKLAVFFVFILICPYLLYKITTPFELLLIQSFSMLFILSTNPAMSVLYSHLPIFKRFTYATLIFAITRAIMAVLTSFGFVYLVEYYGHWGLLIIMVPLCIGFAYGLNHFEELEKKAGCYY
jgi:MFS family permease